MLKHKRNVHMKEKYIDPLPPVAKSTNMTFKHPFSMVVSGPSGSGKLVRTKELLLASLIQPSPEGIIWFLDNGNLSTMIFRRKYIE